MKSSPLSLDRERRTELLDLLQRRFEQHPERHAGLSWTEVLARLEGADAKLVALDAMERSGGEPDVVEQEVAGGAFVFFDCSPETPKGRVSVCYDRAGLESRKEHKPRTSALDLAAEMGVEILNEAQYRELQALGDFDTKTSSWIATPADIRAKGGALFGDKRYGHVFIYHNGAQSYYAARGFRAALRV